MKLLNLTKHTVLTQKLIIPTSVLDQSLGLLKYKLPASLMLKTRFGIHMFGMRYAIDVVVIDQQNTVVKCKTNLKPNTIFLWHPRYDTVLELPEGTIVKSQTLINDQLAFQE